jgi:ketosteroid isomerase-like protein
MMKDNVIKEFVSEMNAQDFDKLMQMYAADAYEELCEMGLNSKGDWSNFVNNFVEGIEDGLRMVEVAG